MSDLHHPEFKLFVERIVRPEIRRALQSNTLKAVLKNNSRIAYIELSGKLGDKNRAISIGIKRPNDQEVGYLLSSILHPHKSRPSFVLEAGADDCSSVISEKIYKHSATCAVENLLIALRALNIISPQEMNEAEETLQSAQTMSAGLGI